MSCQLSCPCNKSEAGACRNKPKSVLSDDDQVIHACDEKFLEAIKDGKLDGVKEMIGAGQKTNVGDEGEESSFHKALLGIFQRAREAPSVEAAEAIYKDTQLVECLVEKGAFVDYPDKNGKRPINLCFDAQHFGVPICELLLNFKDSTGSRVLNLAATRQQNGNHQGNTLLHDVAWAGNAGCMKLLLQTNAFNLEAVNTAGQTALHFASFRSAKESVKLLTDAGAKVDAVERNPRRLSKETACDMALAMGRDDTADYLKSLGATVNAVKAVGRFKKLGNKSGEADSGAAA
jgi:ankyrin repeat protein